MIRQRDDSGLEIGLRLDLHRREPLFTYTVSESPPQSNNETNTDEIGHRENKQLNRQAVAGIRKRQG